MLSFVLVTIVNPPSPPGEGQPARSGGRVGKSGTATDSVGVADSPT
jgi:hypothetical protein